MQFALEIVSKAGHVRDTCIHAVAREKKPWGDAQVVEQKKLLGCCEYQLEGPRTGGLRTTKLEVVPTTVKTALSEVLLKMVHQQSVSGY
jgi:hypothetical protein